MKHSIRLQAQSVWWIFPTTSQMNNVSSNRLWFIGKYRIIVGMKYWDLYAMSISKSLHSPKWQGRGTLGWKVVNRAKSKYPTSKVILYHQWNTALYFKHKMHKTWSNTLDIYSSSEDRYLWRLGGQLWAKNLVGDGDYCLVIIMMIINRPGVAGAVL